MWSILLRVTIAVFTTILWVPSYWWDRKKGRHIGFTMHSAAPILFLSVFPITYFLYGTTKYFQGFLSFLASYSVYSALLLTLTPLLRKRYSAELCADLWLMPNIGYLVFVYEASLLRPFAVLRIGRVWFWALIGVWAAGFLAVFGWKIISHFRFRRQLLKHAEQDDYLSYVYVEERYNILAELERERSRLPDRKEIVYSPDAVSPLSIGLIKRRIVLPKRFYEEKDLQMILRHETTHLLREDNGTKFFLTFLLACYWFLPFSWLGLSRASEDLELCCDELATARLTPEERKRYAELLLSNAGSAPGFTTCLSASASGLRYRLQRVLHPVKTKSGIFLLAVVMLLFLFSLQAVCFAPGVGKLDEAVFDGISNAERIVMRVEDADDTPLWKPYLCDSDALHTVLSQVEAYRADSYYIDGAGDLGEERLGLSVFCEDSAALITCYENGVCLMRYQLILDSRNGIIIGDDDQNRVWKRNRTEEVYLYDTPPDWDALFALAQPLPTD